ncbi:MAG: hypothetical protein IJC19_02725, partial [Clostridia bacterium]|nr:hypothetical protein [Clostridia bacterium]
MKNRFKFKLVAILLATIFAFSMLTGFSTSQTLIGIDTVAAIEKINAFSAKDIVYSIENVKLLESASGDDYVLYDLLPYGYAVLTTDGYFSEACYENGVNPPVPMTDGNTYYYLGPACFALKTEEDAIVNVRTGEEYSQEDLASVAERESEIKISRAERKAEQVSTASNATRATTSSTVKVDATYFENLIDYGNNQYRTCAAVAAAILLGYYDYKYSDAYVPSEYEYQSNSSVSPGTTESFHSLMCLYIWGNGPIGGATMQELQTGLNTHLSWVGSPATFNIDSI